MPQLTLLLSIMEGSRVGWGIGSRAVVRLRIHSSSLVLDISYEASLVVCMVGNYLDTTIRKGYSVLSSHHTVFILYLLLCKVSSGVGILNSELVCERSGRNLVWVMVYWGWGVGCRGMVQGSSFVV